MRRVDLDWLEQKGEAGGEWGWIMHGGPVIYINSTFSRSRVADEDTVSFAKHFFNTLCHAYTTVLMQQLDLALERSSVILQIVFYRGAHLPSIYFSHADCKP